MVIKEHNQICTIVEENPQEDIIFGEINLQTNHCLLPLNSYSTYSKLISSIRTCIHFFLEQNNGFLLHASCGTINDNAYIITGKSNSGKTTALCNLKPDKIIAADVIAIKNHKDSAYIFSTPFRREKQAATNEPKAIFFPIKSKEKPKLTLKKTAAAVNELIANTMFSSKNNHQLYQKVLDTIFHFCDRIPAFDLYFSKTTNLRTLIP